MRRVIVESWNLLFVRPTLKGLRYKKDTEIFLKMKPQSNEGEQSFQPAFVFCTDQSRKFQTTAVLLEELLLIKHLRMKDGLTVGVLLDGAGFGKTSIRTPLMTPLAAAIPHLIKRRARMFCDATEEGVRCYLSIHGVLEEADMYCSDGVMPWKSANRYFERVGSP